jgi:5-methylcytosine-specific restriction endonuclease McrA
MFERQARGKNRREIAMAETIIDDLKHELPNPVDLMREGRMEPLERCPALILNADYRPLSYFPLSLWSWQDAIKAIFRGSVDIVAEYDRTVRSPGFEMKLPSVLALKDFVPNKRTPAFTRFNVFLRDEWQCQYCGGDFKTHELTFDHVIPRCRGGKTSWDNIVSACRTCNLKKGSKTPKDVGMHLKRLPMEPSTHLLQERGRKFPPHFLHESWDDFLYWESELESA